MRESSKRKSDTVRMWEIYLKMEASDDTDLKIPPFSMIVIAVAEVSK